MKSVLAPAIYAATLVFALCLPSFSQEAAPGSSKCPGGGEGAKCGPVPVTDDRVRVVFDQETAKGEITCSKGIRKAGKLKFSKCSHKNTDKYGDLAVLKGIVTKEKYDALAAKKKKLAMKLAFYDSARRALALMIKGNAAGSVERLRADAALDKVESEFDEALGECAKTNGELVCPVK